MGELSGANTDQMLKSSQDFMDAKTACDRVKGNMEVEMTQLVSGWGGEASIKYNQMMVEWTEDFDKICADLTFLSQQLAQDSNTYKTTEQNNMVK